MSTQTMWQSTVKNPLLSTGTVPEDWDINSDGTSPNSYDTSPNLIYQEFLSALAKCFLVIFVGYLSAKLRLLNEREANGLEIFVRQFALPSLIFLTLASVELNRVNWGVIKCFALAKIIIFITVLLTSISVSKPINVGKAGLYSIFCTQSNDLCLGLPIVQSLYQSTHPEFSNYLYLLALVQYLMLNPFGFFLMELQRRGDQHGTVDKSFINILGALVKCTFLNPIIVMTLLGIIANLCWNHHVPVMLEKFLDVLGVAFPATALFCLGYSLVSNSNSFLGARLITPSLLIVTKILILPLVNRFIMHLYVDVTQSSEKGTLENFAFLYGTIPTAPTVYIFATQYNMETDVVATGMVVSTFLSAPLLFLSGSMSTVADFMSSYLQTDLSNVVILSGILGTVCSLWVLGVLIRDKKTSSITHGLTVCIVAFQLLAALGGIFRSGTGPHSKLLMCVQHFLSLVGVLSSHVWTALLAFNISILYGKSLCFGIYIRKYIKMFGFCVSFIIGVTVTVVLVANLNSRDRNEVDFLFNGTEANICVVVLVTSSFSIIFSLITQQWYFNSKQLRPSSSSDENSLIDASVTDSLIDPDISTQNLTPDEEEGISDIEELQYSSCVSILNARHQTIPQPFHMLCEADSKCLGTNKTLCAASIKKYNINIKKSREQGIIFELYEDRHQILKHVILVILLFVAMIMSLVINFWKLLLKEKSSIYVELEFLDASLCHGLGIITFAVFGLDRNLVINPCRWWLWRLLYRSETLVLPEMQNLQLKTRHICNIFLTYHVKNCVHDIVKDRKIGTRKYLKVFCGNDLVDWLIEVGLSHSRIEAEEYGNHLLLGRVIKHVKQRYYFEDLPHLYVFSSPLSSK